MQNLYIGRFADDPQAQGVVKPDDGRWQLVIDREGYPHLYVQVNTTDDDGKPTKGLLALEDMLPDKLTVRDLMDGGEFGGRLPPEEEAEAYAAFQAEERRIPCPKLP
jgi:hypothetical protein